MSIILFYFLMTVFLSDCLLMNTDLFRNKQMIDLTHALEKTSPVFPGTEPFTLTIQHNTTNEAGVWFQFYNYGAGEHFGTHIDAPRHFDENGWTVDQIPIERFIAPAIVVDISAKAAKDPNALLAVDDLLKWEKRNGRIPNGSVVLVNSGYGKYWSNASAYLGLTEENLKKFQQGQMVPVNFPGCGKEAANFLVANRSIIGLGLDTTSIDAGNQSKEYPAHLAVLKNKIYGLENVANVYKLPPSGITLFVFPIKSAGGTGGPVRIVALIDKKKKNM